MMPDRRQAAMVERLRVAPDDHDLATLVAVSPTGTRNETPSHPERGFTGRDQVRRNWEQIFATSRISPRGAALAVDGDTAWTEWEHRAPVPTGRGMMPRRRHLRRGGGVAECARFYLEPVDRSPVRRCGRAAAGRARRPEMILVRGWYRSARHLVVAAWSTGMGLAVRVTDRAMRARAGHLAAPGVEVGHRRRA